MQEVKLHDGPTILLRKIGRDYDPTDKAAAMSLLEEARAKQEFITGLIYIDESRPTFSDINKLPETPLAALAESQLRSSADRFATVMEEFV